MPALSAFHPYIVPIAPGIPEFAIDRALVDSAIQFCRDTWVWQETLDPVEVVLGTTSVDLAPLAPATVISVIQAQIGDEPMYASEFRDMHRLAYLHVAPSLLYISPELVGTLTARAVLEPSYGDTTLADTLFDEWREPICAGAASRVHLMTGDVDRATVYSRIFQDGLARARAHKAVTRSKRRLRTTPTR